MTLKFMATLTGLTLAALTLSPAAYSDPVSYVLETPLTEDIRQSINESLPDEEDAKSALQARRQARRARQIIAEVLNSYGYYDPQITLTVIESDNGAPVKGQVNVVPGPLFSIDRILYKYSAPEPKSDDQRVAEGQVELKSQDAAIPAQVLDVRRVLVQAYRARGYAFAEADEPEVIGDRDAATLSVRYNINTGHKIALGDVRYPDDIQTRMSYLDKLNPLKPGETYAPNDLAQFNSRLAETRLFDVASARLSAEPVGMTEDGREIRDITVELKERPRHSLTLGATLDTVQGAGLKAELLRRNLTRRGDILIATFDLAERLSGIDLIWRRPNEFGYGEGLVFTGAAFTEQTDAYDAQTARIGLAKEVVRGPQLSYSYGALAKILRETGPLRETDFQTLSVFGAFQLDRSDSVLDPTTGWRANARIEPIVPFSSGVSDPYLRSTAHLRGYYPVLEDGRGVIAGRVRIGSILGGSNFDIPISERFYSGGGGSVRGFAYQAIGPRDANNVPLGGRSLLEGSVEARYKVKATYGAVVFIDGGSITDEAYPTFEDFRFGLGAGVRYQTPAGPLRFDVAMPLDKRDGDDAVQVYLSLGQAF